MKSAIEFTLNTIGNELYDLSVTKKDTIPVGQYNKEFQELQTRCDKFLDVAILKVTMDKNMDSKVVESSSELDEVKDPMWKL